MLAARMLGSVEPLKFGYGDPALDDMLWSLLRVGLFDRNGQGDPRNVAAQQSMKYSAALATRIIHRQTHMETQVNRWRKQST
jgi:hypothetical protein